MRRPIWLCLAVALMFITAPAALAHRDGCHAHHSCPSDTGSYVCGDTGNDSECPNRSAAPTAAPVRRPMPTAAPVPAPAPTAERCFDETGMCVAGGLRAFWERNGAETILGFPVDTGQVVAANGRQIIRYSFQRFWIDYDPAQQEPYTYQVGIMGEARLLQDGRVWQNEPQAAAKANCRFFSETGHNICGAFWNYWQAHGLSFDADPQNSYQESLALLGFPLTEEETYTAQGRSYTVQWFQRGRMELHPENAGTPYIVQLGLLNNEIREHAAQAPPPSTEPQPTAAPAPAPAIQSADVLNGYRKKMPKGLWQVNDRGIRIAATGFEYKNNINDYNDAGAGFKYVTFALEMANEGYNSQCDDTFYANATSFTLVDLDSQVHEIESALYGTKTYFAGGTFYPGTKANGVMVFRIPEGSAPAMLIYDTSERVTLDLRVAPQ